MTRVFDRDRPAHVGLPPLVIAKQRSERLADPIDRAKFLDAFTKARVASARGDARLYTWYRAALEADDSVVVAGYIEGAASVNGQMGTVTA
ncbi:hypothetical protein SEA_MAIH_31 [Streptomyces phage Maih]|uniref:Uncharacterized protein n=5 Tax=Woodruffvirus TP1604 TaxID=1982746 RepID=A0A1P8VW34_9CAUD|nr:hypothetical protein AVT62_gp32 [Streptomyces phage TP1604]ALY07281.1 hypothetical protein SEA_MAIH_31 [Streptomyces phage Maih]APZ82200.1 hypothetical protein SEA_BABYGOTBAC_32 [Streptomyces phage BabyGotBac]AWN08392.1 hypothetical protein SEA_BAYC_32 [Streptomyces phage BayC]AWN08462.1 hypothetical protein SEA_SALETE_32 [Streptomyces phage Salete]USH45407.1 hypothetical protein SEA_ASIS_32 [Streptomyces phage Asis]